MDASMFTGIESNFLTLAVVGIIVVVYKRLQHSKCSSHSKLFDCESVEIREEKDNKKKDLFMSVLKQFQADTKRDELSMSPIILASPKGGDKGDVEEQKVSQL